MRFAGSLRPSFTPRLHVQNGPVTARWDHPGVRRTRFLAATAVVAAALAAGSPAWAGPGKGNEHGNGRDSHGSGPSAPVTPGRVGVQGVVQAVSATSVLVRLLDGTTVTVQAGRGVVVIVDGRPSRLTAVHPGYVLVSITKTGRETTLRFVRPT